MGGSCRSALSPTVITFRSLFLPPYLCLPLLQLDPAYVSNIALIGETFGIEDLALKRYLQGCKPVIVRDNKINHSLVADAFMLHNVATALSLRELFPGISDAKIDVLFILGLVHFPPSEGGPLNYLARQRSAKYMTQSLDKINKKIPFTKDIEQLRSLPARLYKGELFVVDCETENMDEMGLTLFSASDLRKIGPTRGVMNREVFLLPIPIILLLGSWLLLIIIFITLLVQRFTN